MDSKLILKKIIRKCNYMKKINRHVTRSEKYLIMDLETRTINGVMNPISVSWYDGKNSHSYYVIDFISSDEMLE